MSQALLKRSLEILEADLEPVKQSASSKAKKPINKSKQKDSVMNLMPESQRLTCYTRDIKNKTKRKCNQPFIQHNTSHFRFLEHFQRKSTKSKRWKSSR